MKTRILKNLIFKILSSLWIVITFQGVRGEPPNSKSTKFTLLDFKSTVDSVYVKEFRRLKPEDNIYNCEIVKEVRALYVDVIINQLNRNREVYRLSNMEGCIFLSNPLFNRIFYSFYENLLVNRSNPMKCPIKKGSYLFRNAFTKSALPQIHPKGNFTLNLRLKSNTHDEIMLDLQWLYRMAK